jgi:DNA-3-methyladenine glycosylase I
LSLFPTHKLRYIFAMAAQPVRKSILHEDGLHRCPWPGTDPLYVAYHDEEWGVPEWDSRALFEKLILDGFQAGLSWITILRKRDAFRKAFDGFEPAKIARYKPAKVEKLMLDTGIVRNRSKIESTIKSAQVWLDIEANQGFANYLWDFVDGVPVQGKLRHMGEMLTESDISRAISKDLKKRGFNYCGPTIVYAFMQAVGMVNDHLPDCHRHAACAALAKTGGAKSKRSGKQ